MQHQPSKQKPTRRSRNSKHRSNSPQLGTINTPPNYQLRCYYTNPTSLNSEKLTELTILTQLDKSPHIIFIAETWFSDKTLTSISDGNSPSDYTLYNRDRGEKGGGVAIYVRNELDSCEVADESLRIQLCNQDIEQVWCVVKVESESILVGCVYRPPPSKAIPTTTIKKVAQQINKSIKAAKRAIDTNKFSGLLLVGDFNYPDINWNDEGTISLEDSEENSKPSENYVKLINDTSLCQSVTFPTQCSADGTLKNTLDLVITEAPQRISELEQGEPLGQSYRAHMSITWNYELKAPPLPKKRSCELALRRGDYTEMSEHLETIDWVQKLNGIQSIQRSN